jgi:hypothetical protein
VHKKDNYTNLNLKNQIKQLRVLVEQRDEELLSLKKSIKCSRMSELEIERKTYMEESVRLRGVIDRLVE